MPKPSPPPDSGRYRYKRIVDLALGGVLLAAALPCLLLIAALVRLKLGSPVLFRQSRPGLSGKPFTILKFRTMTDLRDPSGNLLADAERLPPFGAFLRRASLDELPELFNVLKGEMSLVGPRPLLLEYLPCYTANENRRHHVRPGITGWAQIHGRNYLPWQERLEHDVWYVDHCSLRLDLQILWRTLWLVLRRDGVAADPDVAETNLNEERSRHAADRPASNRTDPPPTPVTLTREGMMS